MKNYWKYILVGALVFGLSFSVAMSFFGAGTFGRFASPYGQGFNSWGMGSHMMGGWGMHGISGFFGGFWMLGMWLIPLLTLGLIITGIVWLIRSLNKDTQVSE